MVSNSVKSRREAAPYLHTPNEGSGPRKGWYLDTLTDMLSLRASHNLISVLIHNCLLGAAVAVKH